MTINIVLANLGQYVSAATTLTFIVLLHVLELVLFYNPQLKISEQDKRGVTQKGFGQWTKECENMEIYPPPKVDSAGTHVYTPPYHLISTCIHVVVGDPSYILGYEHETEDEVREQEYMEAS